jgi:hypothetical protein
MGIKCWWATIQETNGLWLNSLRNRGLATNGFGDWPYSYRLTYMKALL